MGFRSYSHELKTCTPAHPVSNFDASQRVCYCFTTICSRLSMSAQVCIHTRQVHLISDVNSPVTDTQFIPLIRLPTARYNHFLFSIYLYSKRRIDNLIVLRMLVNREKTILVAHSEKNLHRVYKYIRTYIFMK